MEIETDYATKLFFPTPSFVQVIFEAVANAFDAQATEIDIRLVPPPGLEMTIRDNGEGFTDERFERFARLKEPVDASHKGLGRLVYLRYFSHVRVESKFGRAKRSFIFSNAFDGTSAVDSVPDSEPEGTTLRFTEFVRPRLQTKDHTKPEILRSRLWTQFLPLLYEKKRQGQHFRITITLEPRSGRGQREFVPESAAIENKDVPDLARVTFKDTSSLWPDEIHMYYAILDGGPPQFTAICVDKRTIPIDLISNSAVPLGRSAIFLFESALFTGKSDTTRERLDLPIDASVHRLLRKQIGEVLAEKLPEIVEKNASAKRHIEEKFPHLTGLLDEESVGLLVKDEAVDNAQRRFFKAQKEVLEGDALDDATFAKSLDVSARALTEYILYRELIIKKLSDISSKHVEADVHNLIVPQRRQYHGSTLLDGIYNNNAWLLDDKFMTFRTILSEARMQDLIAAIAPGEGANDDTRPDISMIFSDDPAQASGVDVVVVELKRRTADAKENTYAGLQLVQRAIRLADYCHAIQRIWYFAVIEIDEALSQLLMSDNYTPLFSRGRHVYYREFPARRADGHTVPTPVCLLSFDAIIKDAAARNHAFLEILKSAFKRAKTRPGD